MTSDERGLIDAIRDDPDDDGVRLVYADWLEEDGRADHAELIRVQIARARGDRRKALGRREGELVEVLKAAWPAALAGAGVSYRRGMGAAEWGTVGEFTEASRRLREAGSPAWVVECALKMNASGWLDADFKALAESPDFARLTGLDLRQGERLTAATPVALGKSPYGVSLRWLALQGLAIGDKGAAALASLRGLRRLELWPPLALGAKGVGRFANSRLLGELRELVLVGCVEDEGSVVALSKASGLPRLRSLCLTRNNVGDARLRSLLESPLLSHVEELILAANKIRDGGARAIASCEALKGLQRLNLNGNQIGEEGARALLESPHLTALEELDVQWQSKISQETLTKLHKRFSKRKKK